MSLLKRIAVSGLIIAATALPVSARADAPTRPNIVVIYADDMGRGDLSAFGNRLIETRNIDSLAASGTKFTSAYTTAPLCSPSRAGMLTGRYQQKFGFEQQVSSGAFPEKKFIDQPDGSVITAARDMADAPLRGVPVSELNIAELFRPQGYRTGVIGKWHLGHQPQYQPQNRGFDYSFVFYGNTSLQYRNLDDPDFVSRKVDRHDAMPDTAWTREGLNAIRQDGKIVDVDGYLLWRFRDEALRFIDSNKDRPFLLYLPINAPVPPLQVPHSYYDKLSGIADPNVRAYQAFLLAYDDVVGAVLAQLKKSGLEDSTIVIFASDNGNAETRPGSNAPFSGGKFNTYEGGIRTPYIIKWPGHIPAGQIYASPVSTLDILPTLAAATRVSLPASKQLDGVNLLPYLDGKTAGPPHDVLYWKLGTFSAVRRGKWKLFFDNAKGITALYDLDADAAEKVDLSAKEPAVRAELKQLYETWQASLPPPSWTN